MMDRRGLLRLTVLAGAAHLVGHPAYAQRFVAEGKPKPGEFFWEPARAADGAVVIIVSIPEQLVHVYRGGIEIGWSTCSTGKPGHKTPTGVFTILEKQRQHVSSIYKGAQMPNMERLTWGGIALHAGNLPGFPASHGCIRLPLKFSALLFEVTHSGTPVIVADERTQPNNVVHPGVRLAQSAALEARVVTPPPSVAHRKPWDATVKFPLASVVISRADGMAHVWRDGVLAGSYPVGFTNVAKPIGTHVYALIGPAADGSGLLWMAFGLGKKPSEAHVVHWAGEEAMRRVVFHDPKHAQDIADSFHAGATVLITDAAAGKTTRTAGKDFAVMASDTDA